MLEIAAELTRQAPVRTAKVLLDRGGDGVLGLFGSSTIAGIRAVTAREAALAIVNPSATLTLAYRGTGPFEEPQPVRTIAVIPSRDEYVLAVNPATGLRSFDEIATRRPRLRVGVREQPDHSLHFMLDDIMRASGFARDDVVAWGGEFRFAGGVPGPASAKFRALVDGSLDAVWDEGADEWLEAALAAGMRVLSLSETALQQLERTGYRRAVIAKERHPRLSQDVLTVDFSGWPVFVHAELSDDLVAQICAALETRVQYIPWQEESPLTIGRMVRNAADAPYDAPLHPAAERFWRSRGLL